MNDLIKTKKGTTMFKETIMYSFKDSLSNNYKWNIQNKAGLIKGTQR